MAGVAPPPAPAQPARRPPKTQLPDPFLGKSAAAARHFLEQCTNYIAIAPFPDPETEIRWALQLMKEDAAAWRNEMLAHYHDLVPPAMVTDWDHFVEAFKD